MGRMQGLIKLTIPSKNAVKYAMAEHSTPQKGSQEA
jgi:hypothetical protein